MDLRQVGCWLLVCAFFVSLCLLGRLTSLVRSVLGLGSVGQRLTRIGSWAVDRWQAAPELDPLADDLRKVLRREQLRRHIQRLQRILADDTSMSATRQLANRMAYAWLVGELDAVRDLGQPRYLEDDGISWRAPTPSWAPDRMSSAGSPRGSQVEVLEIGWRS